MAGGQVGQLLHQRLHVHLGDRCHPARGTFPAQHPQHPVGVGPRPGQARPVRRRPGRRRSPPASDVRCVPGTPWLCAPRRTRYRHCRHRPPAGSRRRHRRPTRPPLAGERPTGARRTHRRAVAVMPRGRRPRRIRRRRRGPAPRTVLRSRRAGRRPRPPRVRHVARWPGDRPAAAARRRHRLAAAAGAGPPAWSRRRRRPARSGLSGIAVTAHIDPRISSPARTATAVRDTWIFGTGQFVSGRRTPRPGCGTAGGTPHDPRAAGCTARVPAGPARSRPWTRRPRPAGRRRRAPSSCGPRWSPARR